MAIDGDEHWYSVEAESAANLSLGERVPAGTVLGTNLAGLAVCAAETADLVDVQFDLDTQRLIFICSRRVPYNGPVATTSSAF